MLETFLALIALVLFFAVVLHVCVGNTNEAAHPWDAAVELARKSPLGRWRY